MHYSLHILEKKTVVDHHEFCYAKMLLLWLEFFSECQTQVINIRVQILSFISLTFAKFAIVGRVGTSLVS